MRFLSYDFEELTLTVQHIQYEASGTLDLGFDIAPADRSVGILWPYVDDLHFDGDQQVSLKRVDEEATMTYSVSEKRANSGDPFFAAIYEALEDKLLDAAYTSFEEEEA